MSDEFSFQGAAACGPPLRFGDYRVLDRLAEGGMGLIFRGQHLRTGRLVAIKTACSRREVDAAAIRREIVVLSNLRHPGIIRLHTHDEESGVPWMALELLEGRTLGEEISWYWPETATRDSEPRPATDELPTTPVRGLRDRAADPARPAYPVAASGHLVQSFSVLAQLCAALDHVHRHGLVHRDVKPANVFLGDDGRTTLIDFGLACPLAATGDSNVGVGTMEYAAPEQICGGPVDRRADIYSLGCMLYELVTGQLPFRGDSASEIAKHQIWREPVVPSRLSADVPSQLDDLVMSMLAKTPARRPESATEVGWRLTNIARRLQQRSGQSAVSTELGLRRAG